MGSGAGLPFTGFNTLVYGAVGLVTTVAGAVAAVVARLRGRGE
jgi:hypothetical protein